MVVRTLAWLAVAITAFLVSIPAFAANITIENYQYDGQTQYYIYYNGETTEDDMDKLKNIIERASRLQGFDRTIWLNGPGGVAYAGLEMADMIREAGLETVVGKGSECASACSVMWLAGTERWLQEDGWVGFHHPYVSDVDYLNNTKDAVGWLGIQDQTSQSTMWFFAQMIKYGIADVYNFSLMLSGAGHNTFLWVGTERNLELIGGVRTFK